MRSRFFVQAALHLILGLFALFCLAPLGICILLSFSSPESIREFGLSLWPKGWSAAGYIYLFQHGLLRSLGYGLPAALLGGLMGTLLCVPAGYALYRNNLKWRRFWGWFFFLPMFFSLLPRVDSFWYYSLGLRDTIWLGIVPLMISPLFIFMMRGYFRTALPVETLDAARLDGCGEYGVLWRIAVPLAKPGIAAVAFLSATQIWNDHFYVHLFNHYHRELYGPAAVLFELQDNRQIFEPVINAFNPESYTLNPLYKLLASDEVLFLAPLALAVLAAVPVAVAFPFVQRHIAAGLDLGKLRERA